MIEFAIWGIIPGDTYESLLSTKAKSKIDAQNICNILQQKYGCKNCRIQIVNLAIPPYFKNVLSEEIK